MSLPPPFIPDTAPFTAEQRAWLNGFFAGLFSGAPAATAAPPTPVTILVGTQTGTSESVAKATAKTLKKHNLAPKIVNMLGYEPASLTQEERVLVITSTYGEGEMPDGVKPLWEALSVPTAPRLESVRYAVLALGDSSYAKFCNAGKLFDARLAELGAKRLHPRVDCDKDYEEPFAAWLKGVLPLLGGPGAPAEAAGAAAGLPAAGAEEEEDTGWSARKPCPAHLLECRNLNAPGSGKETRHVSIAIDGAGLTYEPGDALGIIAQNCPDLVEDVVRALGCGGEEGVLDAQGEIIALRKALTDVYDLRTIGRPLLEAVAKKLADSDPTAQAEQHRLVRFLDPEARAELEQYLWGREVIDVLLEHPQVKFTLPEFVGLLRKLPHRLYSIASSPRAHPGQVHLTVAVVRYEAHQRLRKGVCSSYLAERVAPNGPLKIFVQENSHYRLPANGDTPVIMIGPGTGVAPFRAFLQERQATGAKGKNWLFFGDRSAATDFLYRTEFEALQAGGVLTRLDTAFSRDQPEKIYVQHRMLEQAAELFAWLEAGAYLYVCGDATHMAKDVDRALHEVIAKAGHRSAEAAAEYVKNLAKAQRYLRDVY